MANWASTQADEDHPEATRPNPLQSGTLTTDQPPVTLINLFTVPADKIDGAIQMWEQARDFLAQQPGYISTALHQALAPDATFQLINIAKWESKEAFRAATSKMRTEVNLPRIEGVVGSPALYNVIRS